MVNFEKFKKSIEKLKDDCNNLLTITKGKPSGRIQDIDVSDVFTTNCTDDKVELFYSLKGHLTFDIDKDKMEMIYLEDEEKEVYKIDFGDYYIIFDFSLAEDTWV